MKIGSIKGITFRKLIFINKIILESSGNVVYDHEDFGQIKKWYLVG